MTRARGEKGPVVSSAQDQPAGTTDRPSATTAGTGAVPGQRATQEGYQEQQPEYGRPEDRREDRRRHYGMAATLMILSGLLTCFIGITAIIKGIFFNSVATFPFYYSVRSRGVTLLVIGAVVLVVGIALLVRMHWARHAATAVAVISALANFVFLPFYPFWSVIVLAIDVIIIWELTREERTPGRRYALAAPSVACGSRSCQSWRAQSRSAASRPGSGAMAVAPTMTPGGPRVRVHRHLAHGAEVDGQPAVADRRAAEVVRAAAHRHPQAGLLGRTPPLPPRRRPRRRPND